MCIFPCTSTVPNTAQALIRDNYQCVVSAALDKCAPQELLAECLRAYPYSMLLSTECCHIIPESLINFTATSADETCEEYAEVGPSQPKPGDKKVWIPPLQRMGVSCPA